MYDKLDYRAALRSALDKKKSADPDFTQKALAERMGVQSPYLSAVFASRAELNGDQIFRACRALDLDEGSTAYLLGLLEWQRSTDTERRRILRERIEKLREEKLKSREHLQAKPVPTEDVSLAEYYLDPWVIVVHVCLGVPKFAGDIRRVGEALGLGGEAMARIVRTLERLGYIERKANGRYQVRVRHRHLPDDSPLCPPHQAGLRLQSIQKIQELPPSSRYAFSVTFSADEEVRCRIRLEFLAFIKRCEAWVKGMGTPTGVYQMNFDLFPWEKSNS